MPTTLEFLLALEQLPDPLGLIVTADDPSSYKLPDVRGGLAQASLTDAQSADDVLSFISDGVGRGRWCRIDVLTADIHPRFYQAMRSLSATGHMQYLKDGEVADVPLAPGAKVVCVIAQATLDRVSIPTFLNLFGIIHRE